MIFSRTIGHVRVAQTNKPIGPCWRRVEGRIYGENDNGTVVRENGSKPSRRSRKWRGLWTEENREKEGEMGYGWGQKASVYGWRLYETGQFKLRLKSSGEQALQLLMNWTQSEIFGT